ncbi:hypothetical protein BJV74DRAFT_792784 [Russula compacta]|nr:hypothetical protein BJV74DRAFT_792784 [Russula compacta]
MLPFPIFLLLLFSATLLAPSPPVLVGFIRTATLQSSTWSYLLSISSSASPSPSETSSLPVLAPIAPLDLSPTYCSPSPVHVAPNNTIPRSFVHGRDDRTTSTAVLLVILLGMFNCLVYKLLVHDGPNGAHGAEVKSEQLMVFPCSTLATSPSEESICHHAPAVDEMPPPFLSLDTAKSVSEFLERESLPHHAVTPPSFSSSSFEVAILSQSPPSEQPLPFLHVLSREFSLDNSERKANGDSCLVTLPASDSTLIIPSSASATTTQSTNFEVWSPTSVVSVAEIDDSKPELPQSTLLGTETAKEDASPQLDLSSIPHPQESRPGSELHSDHMLLLAIQNTCEIDPDGQDIFSYQPPRFDGDGDETFDYRGVDWTPEAQLTPPVPLVDDPALHSYLHGQFFGHAPSQSDEKSTSDIVNTCNLSPRFSLPLDVIPKRTVVECAARYALDDIQVGMKVQSKGKITSITRCASAGDLGGMFETTKETQAFTVSDGDIVDDDATHNRVTLLRADAPIFKPRSSGMDKDVALLPGLQGTVSVGLKGSIHAPQNDEVLHTQGCDRVSESMHAIRRACAPATTFETNSGSLEPAVETGGFRASIVAVEGRDAQPASPNSQGLTSGIHASVHAPQRLSPGAQQALDENTEKLRMPPTQVTTRSSPTDDDMRSGLNASMHAPKGCLPSQAAQRSPKHSADAPNWAAAARTQDSSAASSDDSFLAQRGNSPDPVVLASELPPTTSRCAVQGRGEGSTSVDNSDGSSDHADDHEGTTTTGSGETDNGLDEADDLTEQQDSTARARRTRRRGKPRRREKVPYVPPPRMHNLTQNPIVDIIAARTSNVLAIPPTTLSGRYYTHSPAPPPHHPMSAPGPMVVPNGIMPKYLGRHPHYNHPMHMGPPHMAGHHHPPTVPAFQPPGPYNPMPYHHGPQPPLMSSQPPFAPLYGR